MGEIEQVWADSTYNNVVTSNHAYISSRNPKHYKFNHSMWYNQKKITNSKNSYFFFDGNPPQKNGFFYLSILGDRRQKMLLKFDS